MIDFEPGLVYITMSSELNQTAGYNKMAASRTNSDSTSYQHSGQDDLTVTIKSGKIYGVVSHC